MSAPFILKLKKYFEWKQLDVNLANNQSTTIPDIANIKEILVKFSYNADKTNFATVHVVNDGVSGYYGMAGYYWNATNGIYNAQFNIDWKTGKIMNNSSSANIVKIFYR